MELISSDRSGPAVQPRAKRVLLPHHPLRLRYALAAIVLSVIGLRISTEFEEQPKSKESTTSQ